MAWQLVLNGLSTGAMIALVSLGFSIQYQVSRVFTFTFAICVTFGAYGALVLRELTLPLPVVVSGGVGVAVCVGSALELSLYSPLRRRKSNVLVLMLASIGTYVLLQNIVSTTFGDETRMLRQGSVLGINIFGGRLTVVQLTNILSASLAVSGIVLFLRIGRWGVSLRAVAAGRELANAVGIDVERNLLVASCIGSAAAGLGGTLLAMDIGLTPTMGFDVLLWAVVGAIIGGIGSLSGAVIGGMLVGMIHQLVPWALPTAWQEAALFLILLLALLFRPQGVFGRRGCAAAI